MRVITFLLLNFLIGSDGWSDTKKRKFPRRFLFGTASSAYQVEGAWNVDVQMWMKFETGNGMYFSYDDADPSGCKTYPKSLCISGFSSSTVHRGRATTILRNGKGESIWDKFVHDNPDKLIDGRNGDVASNSYDHWRRDVEMLRELGVDFYRFSISWPRVMPTGLPNSINEKGFEYYDNLIDELLKYRIQPMVTLYHFDMPQYLQDLGGWTNPLSIDWFVDYAKVVFKRYASKVKFWITMNQPNTICIDGYETGSMAPGLSLKGTASYECIKNVLLAHAKAYRAYEKIHKNKHEGNVGIAIAWNWYDPFNNSTDNQEAVERAREFEIGLYMNPIFSKTGDFPQLVKSIVAKKSQEQGFPTSRLPKLTDEEIKIIKGSADYLGMNHYTTFLVKPSTKQQDSPSIADDMNVEYSQGPEWKQGKSPWLRSAPYGIYKACIYLNQKYNYPIIIITEHGWSTGAGLGDQSRADNMREYFGAILLAMEDGTELKGYTAWSLMDNVEWVAGTSERFGLYEVDFDSPSKKRTARLSAHVYKNVIETRAVDMEWKPKSLNIEITNRHPYDYVREDL